MMQALSVIEAECMLKSSQSDERQLDKAWQLDQSGACLCLQRDFSFKDFVAAMAFAQRVAEVAEAADHHPELLISWGGVKVRWWTHEVSGLHAKDFVCAAAIDDCYYNECYGNECYD